MSIITTILFILLIAFCVYKAIILLTNSEKGSTGEIFGAILTFLTMFLVFIPLLTFANVWHNFSKLPEQNSEVFRLEQEKDIIKKANQQAIEKVIPVLQQYPKYEQELLKDLKPERVLFLHDAYPELKADTFFSKQANIIQANIDSEKEITLKQIQLEKDIKIRKFWIFF